MTNLSLIELENLRRPVAFKDLGNFLENLDGAVVTYSNPREASYKFTRNGKEYYVSYYSTIENGTDYFRFENDEEETEITTDLTKELKYLLEYLNE